MKKRFILFSAIISILISLSAKNPKMVFADETNSEFPELSDEEIAENLETLIQLYQCTYENESECQHNITLGKIDALEDLHTLFIDEGSSSSPSASPDSIDFSFYGAPDCECDWLNIFTGEPCYYCQRYHNAKVEIGAILATFIVLDWYLAADLLSFNLSNTEMDCIYTPSIELSSVLLQSAAINEILQNNKISEGYNYAAPGHLNGIDGNTPDGDSYNSLGSFYYTKNAIDSNTVSLSIYDRYDWNGSNQYGFSISNFLISEMEYAENVGILTPFYTRINFECNGAAICNWEYCDNGVKVIKSFGGFSEVYLPEAVHDFRTLVPNPSEVPLIEIEDEAFKDCISLEKISFPKGLQEIGNDIFLNCSALVSIEFRNDIDPLMEINSDSFYGCDSSFEIVVPLHAAALYFSDNNWNYFSSRLVPNLGFSHVELTLNQSLSVNDSIDHIENPYKVCVVNSTSIYHYNFHCHNDDKRITFSLYDRSFALIASYTGSTINFVKTIGVGTYYCTIQFLDTYTEDDAVQLSISPTDHVYSLYTWLNYSTHKSLCSCGRSRIDGHVVSQSSLGHGRYSICLLCHGSAEVAFVGPLYSHPISLMRSGNGSYILPNGVIVLADNDIELYMNGTLEFFLSDPSLEIM